jgi:hypothetical protein
MRDGDGLRAVQEGSLGADYPRSALVGALSTLTNECR